MKVVIIGSGNVATVLGRKIANAGHEIVQVFGRNEEKLRVVASYLKTACSSNLSKISMLADIYIIAVSDAAISSVASSLQLNDKLVVHTAGSVSKMLLSAASTSYGVLYPLQTLRKEVSTIPSIPILVDGNTEMVTNRLVEFASDIFDNVTVANDEERLRLHLAAVFVNNFSNHLFAVADRYCLDSELDFMVLRPLIEETILRIEENRPSDVQTGPAIRKDFVTIEKHQNLLGEYPKMLELYNCLSNSIIEFYSRNNN